MKRPMYVAVAALAIAALGVTAAHAGWSYGPTVVVNTSARTARGSLGAARASGDSVQYIGCSLVGHATTEFAPQVICEARNASGTYKICQSPATNLIEAARGINGDSYIYFAWDASGYCTYLYVSNMSNYAPKQP